MREQTINTILREKLIVILRGIPEDALLPLASAMYEGGVRLLEVTFDASAPASDRKTAAQIRMLAEHFEGRMLIGAGTVLSEAQVELVAEAGGRFIISPDCREAVIRKTRELGLVSMPGALTPTEVQGAHLAGADFIKLFPVSSLGLAYVKALKAPLSHIKMLAVGGVDLSNIRDYQRAGVCGFGISSAITDKRLIEARDFAAITQLARQYVEAVQE